LILGNTSNNKCSFLFVDCSFLYCEDLGKPPTRLQGVTTQKTTIEHKIRKGFLQFEPVAEILLQCLESYGLKMKFQAMLVL
jgi:hypothetical protein